jgi:hypothetical protein
MEAPQDLASPLKKIFISGETPIVFRTVQELDENMVVVSGRSDGNRWMFSRSFEQSPEGALFINYFDAGSDASLASSNDSNLILARRLALSFHLIFGELRDPTQLV